MAAPHVSGAIAVLLSKGLTPQQAVDQLLATADDLGSPGKDSTFGSGRINLARAVGKPAGGGGSGGGGSGGGGSGGGGSGGGGSGGGGSSGRVTTTQLGAGASTTLTALTPDTSPPSDLGGDDRASSGLTSTPGRTGRGGSDDKPVVLVLFAAAAVLATGGATAWWLLLASRRTHPT
jgi:hypothetical protein